MNHPKSKYRKYFIVLFLLVLAIISLRGIIFSWGCLTIYGINFNTHSFILQEAYKRLEKDPAFQKNKMGEFPLLSSILDHEGCSQPDKDLIGPGPDAKGNSTFRDHYYNPETGEGGAPEKAVYYFSMLKDWMEGKNTGEKIEKSAAYLAHFVADMSVPFHVLGIQLKKNETPDNFRNRITDKKTGQIRFNADIQGFFFESDSDRRERDWAVEFDRWETAFNNDPVYNDWFDLWYFDSDTAPATTHLYWEGVYVNHKAANLPNEYSLLYTSLLDKKIPNGSKQIIEEMTKRRALETKNLLDGRSGSFFRYDEQMALNIAINDVVTVWRATFSALQPLVSIEQDPVTGLNKLIVHLRNLEDTEAAKDINVHVELPYEGELTGPDNWKIPLLEPFVKNVIDNQIDIDKWTIDSAEKDVWVKIVVTGKYVETPDSGKVVLEKKLILPPKTKKIRRIFIKPSDCIIYKGGNKDLVVYAEYTDGSPETIIDSGVSWTSDEEKIATVDDNGKVKAVEVGKTIIRAKVGDYRADASVEVQKAKIKIEPNPLTLTQIGDKYQLQLFKDYPTTTIRVETGVIWESNKPGIVSVDSNTGVVTAEAEGEATITAIYEGERAKGKVLVVLKTGDKKKKTVTLLQFIVKPPNWKNAKQGDTKTFTAFAVFSDNKKKEIDVSNKCDWFPSDQNVISANNGLIEILKPTQGNYSVEVVYTYDGKKNTVLIPIVNLGCPDKITIPDLMGKTVDEARKMIEPCLVLSPTVSPTFDPNYLPGQIVGQIPSPGIIKAKGAKVVVAVNPQIQKPHIGIRIVEALLDHVALAIHRRSFPVGTEITFEEDVINKNPLNTYTFEWYVDGNLISTLDEFTHLFIEPGPHYVQLVMTSSDPTEDDAIIKNINIEYSPDIECTISANPSPPYSAPVTITFTMNCQNLDASTITAYSWYIDDDLKQREAKNPFSWTFDTEGTYIIKCGIRLGSNFDEITATITITIGGAALRPDDPWKNKFEARESEKGVEIFANYWIEGLGKWSDWSGFRNLGEVDGYALCTGEQADLYNTGFLLYSPKGSDKLLFEVYRYDFERLRGILVNSGSVDMHGKTFKPDSVSIIDCQSRAADFQWSTEDGSLCKARVWKYGPSSNTGTITQNTFVNTGVEDLGCIELDKEITAASGGSVIEAMETTARAMGIQPPEAHVMTGTELENHVNWANELGMSKPICIYLMSENPLTMKGGNMVIYLFPSGAEAEAALPIWRNYLRTHRLADKTTLSEIDFHGLSASFWTVEETEDQISYSMGWIHRNAYLSFSYTHKSSGEAKTREIGEKLYEEFEKISNSRSLYECDPIIKELESSLGSKWPTRLQDGKLDVRGAEARKFKWSDNWITVDTGVINFWGTGTDLGPVVIYTKGPKQWYILTLNYASGAKENEMSFTEPITIIRSGTWGAFIKVGDKCYEYSRNPLRAVDCETLRIIYDNSK